MSDTAGTIAIGAAALLYMAKTVYELARGISTRRNGNGKPPTCSTEVIAILRQQTTILERTDEQGCRILEATQKHSEDMRELLVTNRTERRSAG